MHIDCDVDNTELSSYADRELSSARLTFLDHHVPSCPRCQRRLIDSDWVGGVLDTATVPITRFQVETQKAALLERLRQDDNHRRRSTIVQGRLRAVYWRPLLVALIAIVLLSLFTMPRDTWADFSLSRLIDFTRIGRLKPSSPSVFQEQYRPAANPPGVSADVTVTGSDMLVFDPVILDTLPDGSMLVSTTVASPQQLELTYARDDGLSLTIIEVPATDSQMAIEREYYQREQIGAIDVLLLLTPEFSAVTHLIWEHDGIVFSVLVREETSRMHLTHTDARALVIKVIQAQE